MENVVYSTLMEEIKKRGIKKTAIAKAIGISSSGLDFKLSGESAWRFNEAIIIRDRFFPDMGLEELFKENDVKQ